MESYSIESNKKKSRIPARLDFLQSSIGLVLGLFVWVHIILSASIILGPGAFNWVSKNMELAFLSNTGQGYPIAVFFAVVIVFILFIVHALLGIRKFPISWKQHRIMRDQMAMMKHQDTNLWYVQALTGFIMFFAGSVHLYSMLTHPGSIDAYLSADRVVSQNMWFIYLILLVCVVLHGNIGLYRLCMKWGWFQGADYQRGRQNRAKLKNLQNKLMIFFLSAGFLTLLLFVIIGLRHKYTEPYQATDTTQTHKAAEPAAVEKAPEAEPIHEQTDPLIEEPVTHDSTPAVQESEFAHEEAADDPGDVQEEIPEEISEEVPEEVVPEEIQEETAGDDAAHEAPLEEAGSLESEEHPAEGDVHHSIEGGSGPQEIL